MIKLLKNICCLSLNKFGIWFKLSVIFQKYDCYTNKISKENTELI